MRKTKQKVFLCLAAALLAAGLCAFFFAKQNSEQKLLDTETQLLLETIANGETTWEPKIDLDEIGTTFYDSEDKDDVLLLPYHGEAGSPVTVPVPQTNHDTNIEALGILQIDAIDLKLPVSYGVSERSLKISPGWIPQSSPIGEIGNAVIAGHRNYKKGSQFNRLGDLVTGDVIWFLGNNQKLRYQVSEILEVLPGDPAAFESSDSTSMLTLYTCTPIKTATHRLVIRAILLDQ